MHDFVLERPRSISEALEILKNHGEKAILKSGGTDVIVWLHKSLKEPEYLVDLTSIDGLRGIVINDDNIEIRALVTLNQVIEDITMNRYFPALVQACKAHSDPLIRNRATVVGNICAAVPSGDMIAPLMCYDAKIEIVGSKGTREVRVSDFITGPKKTSLSQEEIVTGIRIAIPFVETSGCYLKAIRREALDIAQAAVCCTLHKGDSREFRIAFCAVSPRPLRAVESEKLLNSSSIIDDSIIENAARLAAEAVNPITDVRASREYRIDMIRELTKRAISICLGGPAEEGGPR